MQDASVPKKSRGQVLAGATGAFAALTAESVIRPPAATAGTDGDVVLGGSNVTPSTTFIDISGNTSDHGLIATAKNLGSGVEGVSDRGRGVFGLSQTGPGG